jgi:hypothetical protein
MLYSAVKSKVLVYNCCEGALTGKGCIALRRDTAEPCRSANILTCHMCGCWQVRLYYDLLWQPTAMNLPQKIEKQS